MIQCFAQNSSNWEARRGMSFKASRFVFILMVAALVCGSSWLFAAGSNTPLHKIGSSSFVSEVAQFRNLSAADYLVGCDFRVSGVVTMVDTNRDLIVLQDITAAVALHFPLKDFSLKVGQAVVLSGHNCYPYFAGFSKFPFHPSGRDILPSFETPTDWGNYHLTRIRGYLHPPTTGEYNFLIASDNSSELWLSESTDPSRARKIASIPRYGWVSPHDWSRYPSQRSDSLYLTAGKTYYIEAFSEQTDGGENLSVAWRGPGLDQSVIGSSCLTPWRTTGLETNGVMREYWTNYSAGDLDGLASPRAFESALSVESVVVGSVGPGVLPNPERITLSQTLSPKDDYRWIQAEGLIKFTGTSGEGTSLELSDGQAIVQVRVPKLSADLLSRMQNCPVQVEGVCEGVSDQKGARVPGMIWVASENNIALLQDSKPAITISAAEPSTTPIATDDPAMLGFYGTRGVVTFNDRVFGHDYIFVQENSATMLVNLKSPELKSHFRVGEWVDLGGALEPGKPVPIITPLVVKKLEKHLMPVPLSQPAGLPISENWEGKWSEIEGVVQSIDTNNMMSVAGKGGTILFWVGDRASDSLKISVDTKLRARGVLSLTVADSPVLLVPSSKFVDVEEVAPKNPFNARLYSISELVPEKMDFSWFHRVRIAGEITYKDARSIFVQDASGGIRVPMSYQTVLSEGDAVEVIGFPAMNGFSRTLVEARMRPTQQITGVKAKKLDLSDAFSAEQSGTLVTIDATLLRCTTNANGESLELQEQQRVFAAMLADGRGHLRDLAPGSRLRITGVCNDHSGSLFPVNEKLSERQILPSLNILLRNRKDVVLLNTPPWWTLKRTVILVSALLTVILGTLLWVYLLRRRLERQRAAQLAFSQQVLKRLEDERRRIAANLHDSLGQILLVIKNHALLAIRRPPESPGLQERFAEISGAASQAIEEVRQITHGLRPYQLDRLGLTQAIRASIAQTTTENPISFATRVEDIDGLFEKDEEIHLYRIVQEAVTNVVKHSAATEATIVIKKRTGMLSVSIRDNGRGFDPVKSSSQPHKFNYGLNGIAERVRILGGTLRIESQPGEGSDLTVEIPLPIFLQ